MCWVHRTQAAVCIPHPHYYPGYNPYLWQGSKCHQKGTPETHEEVLRSQKVPLELGGGPEEEHSPIRENWGCDGVEMGLRRREWKGGEQR